MAGRPVAPAPERASAEERKRAFLTLRLLPRVGDRTVRGLLARFGTPQAALAAPRAEFARATSSAAAAERDRADIHRRVDALLRRVEALELVTLVHGCEGYPPALGDLYDPPPLLFLMGDEKLLDARAVAVVGARRASAYGRRVAEALAADLSARGVAVVSGMALGVDAAAHRGALRSGGGTVAVLGSGLDLPHPPSNRGLFRRIAREGLVVSEFLPGDPPLPHHFPRRNRVIAALAAGVVVVEAGRKSGALITVDHATDLGREVFALPGSVEGGRSAGSHALIRDGATLVTDARDILVELGWGERADEGLAGRSNLPGHGGAAAPADLSPDARQLWEALADGPEHVDDLLLRSGMPSARALAALSLLELTGWAVQDAGRRFRRNGTRGTFA